MQNFLFDFTVNKNNNTLTVKREFGAQRQLVWECYTKTELLNRWFAPAPLTTKTASMDFREGGHWLYAMVDPSGQEYWARTDYQRIHPIDFYTALDGFCDNTGALRTDLPRAEWDVRFSDMQEHTLVTTTVQYASLHELESVIQMGMEQGMAATLEKLDQLLLQLHP